MSAGKMFATVEEIVPVERTLSTPDLLKPIFIKDNGMFF